MSRLPRDFFGFLLLVLLAFLPQLQLADMGIPKNLLTELVIVCILALGLNVIIGNAGLLHLGIAAFYGIGCCITGIMTVQSFPFRQSFLVALCFSTIGTAILGFVVSAPVLRLRGDYLALVTLGFGQIVITVLVEFGNITGGKQMLKPLYPPLAPGFDSGWAGPSGAWQDFPGFYYICLGLLFMVFLALRNMERSKLGRGLVAIREDELAASAMGLNPARLKLAALAIGAGLAGMAGSLYGILNASTTEPHVSFSFSLSIIVLAAVILGGLGSRSGVLWGVILLMGFDKIGTRLIDAQLSGQGDSLMKVSTWRLMIFGLVLIFMMRFRPHGLIPEKRGK